MSNLIENMIASGELSTAARDMDPFKVLTAWVESRGVEYVSARGASGWEDYAWEAADDGTTQRIILMAAVPSNDVVLYHKTTDPQALEMLAQFESLPSDIFQRLDGLDPWITDMMPSDM